MGGNALRKCIDCGLEAIMHEALADFVKDKGSKYGVRNLCNRCAGKRNEKHPKMRDWKTDHQTNKRYGVDRETYLERMATSEVCQICGSNSNLCYDHCHDTMEFRGVLCRSCNRSLGQLGDNLESIMKVVKYLKKEKEDDQNNRHSY